MRAHSISFGNGIVVDVSWSAIKERKATTGLPVKFVEDDDVYTIFVQEEGCTYRAFIARHDAEGRRYQAGYTAADNNTDLADFEANFKAVANKPLVTRDTQGNPVQAVASFAYLKQKTRFNGFRYVAAPNAITIFDEEITRQIFVQGGRVVIRNAVDGDYVEFSIVDVDNVLGLFVGYGLRPGIDVLELDKYVRTVYPDEAMDTAEHRVSAAAPVTAGLYFRITYHAVAGGGNRVIKPTYLWYEA